MNDSSSLMEAFHSLTRQIQELVIPSSTNDDNHHHARQRDDDDDEVMLQRRQTMFRYRRQLNQMICQNSQWHETKSVEIESARWALGLWEILTRQPHHTPTWIGESFTQSFQVLMDPQPATSMLELILDPNVLATKIPKSTNWASPTIFQLPELLAQACRDTRQQQQRNKSIQNGHPHRRVYHINKKNSYENDAWKVAYVYILARLVYDEMNPEDMEQQVFRMTTIRTRIESLFHHSFRNSEAMRVGLILFWIDLLVDDASSEQVPSICPSDLTLDYLFHELSAPSNSFAALEYLAQISGLSIYAVAACCVDRLLSMIPHLETSGKDTVVVSVCKKLLGHRHRNYLETLVSMQPNSSAGVQSNQSHIRLHSLGYPLLVHVDVLCHNATTEIMSPAILLATDIEACPVLSVKTKEVAMAILWEALFRTNLLFYDRDTPIESSLAVLFVPHAGALAMDVFIHKFEDLTDRVRECPQLTRSVKEYLDQLIRQTMLRLLYNRYADIPVKYHGCCGIQPTISPNEQKKWVHQYMDLDLEKPSYLEQVTMDDLFDLLHASVDKLQQKEINDAVEPYAIDEIMDDDQFHDAKEHLDEHVHQRDMWNREETNVRQEKVMEIEDVDVLSQPSANDIIPTDNETRLELPASQSPTGSCHSMQQSSPEALEIHSNEDSMETESEEQSMGSGDASAEENYEDEETDEMKEASHAEDFRDSDSNDQKSSHDSREEAIEILDYDSISEDEAIDDSHAIELDETEEQASRVPQHHPVEDVQAPKSTLTGRIIDDVAPSKVHVPETDSEGPRSPLHQVEESVSNSNEKTDRRNADTHPIASHTDFPRMAPSEMDQQSARVDESKKEAAMLEVQNHSQCDLPSSRDDTKDSRLPTKRPVLATLNSSDQQFDNGYEAEDSQDAGTEEEAERPHESIGIGLSLYPGETAGSVDGSNISLGNAVECMVEPAVATSLDVDQGYDAEDSHGHDETPVRKRLPSEGREESQLEKGYEAEDSQFEDEDHTEDEEELLRTEHRETSEISSTLNNSPRKPLVRSDMQTLSDMSAADEAEASELEEVQNRIDHPYSYRSLFAHDQEHPATLHAFATKAQNMDEAARAEARRFVALQEKTSKKMQSIVDKVPEEGIEAFHEFSDSTVSVVGSQQGNSIDTATDSVARVPPGEIDEDHSQKNDEKLNLVTDNSKTFLASHVPASRPDSTEANAMATIPSGTDEQQFAQIEGTRNDDKDREDNQDMISTGHIETLQDKGDEVQDGKGRASEKAEAAIAPLGSRNLAQQSDEDDLKSKSSTNGERFDGVVRRDDIINDATNEISVVATKSGQKRKLEVVEAETFQNETIDEKVEDDISSQQKSKRRAISTRDVVSSPVSTRSGRVARSSTKKDVLRGTTPVGTRSKRNIESSTTGTDATSKEDIPVTAARTRRAAASRTPASSPVSTRSGRLTRSSAQKVNARTLSPARTEPRTRSSSRRQPKSAAKDGSVSTTTASRTRSSIRGGSSAGKDNRTSKKPPATPKRGSPLQDKKTKSSTPKTTPKVATSNRKRKKAVDDEETTRSTKQRTDDDDSVGAVRHVGGRRRPPLPSSDSVASRLRKRSSQK